MNLQIALMILAAASFLVLLFATIKFYRNAKTIDSPENIMASIAKLDKAILGQKSSLAKLESRLLTDTERLYNEGFQQLQSNVHRLAETSIQVQKRLLDILGENNKSMAEIDAQITALRQHTSEQQALLNKFQQGYDYSVNKTLILGLIRAIENMDERIASLIDPDAIAAIEEAKDNILVTLESQNVDQFAPAIGDDYKEHMKIAKATRQATDDPGNVGKIASVLSPGYVYAGGETTKVIRPAQVAVYMDESNEQQGEENE